MDKMNWIGNNYKAKNTDIFNETSTPRLYSSGQLIYQQGDAPDCIYYLKEGKVKIYIPSAEGYEKILAVLTEGSVFGKASFFDKMPRSSSAAAIAKSSIIALNDTDIKKLIKKHPDFALDIIEYMSGTIRMLSSQINSMAFLKADVKVARFITDKFLSEKKSAVVLTHEEIGESLNLSRVTVSRVLSAFKKAGLLNTGYGQIEVLDMEALIRYGYEE